MGEGSADSSTEAAIPSRTNNMARKTSSAGIKAASLLVAASATWLLLFQGPCVVSSLAHHWPSHGRLLLKTKETFKLSDLQHLQVHLEVDGSTTIADADSAKDAAADDGIIHAAIDGSVGSRRANGSTLANRLIVDDATGSSLFQIDAAARNEGTSQSSSPTAKEIIYPNDDVDERTSQSKSYPSVPSLWTSFHQHCDWIGQVLFNSETAEGLIDQLLECGAKAEAPMPHGWVLDYVQFQNTTAIKHQKQLQREAQRETQPPDQVSSHNRKTLICAIANAIPTRPSLYGCTGTTSRNARQLLLVDVNGITDGRAEAGPSMPQCSRHFFLVKIVPPPDETLTLQTKHEEFMRRWAERPFPYSSAINIQIAETTISILRSLCSQTHRDGPLRLLDATCGSGTFLSWALLHGMSAEGNDINHKCIEGTELNLKHAFGQGELGGRVYLAVRDSSRDEGCPSPQPQSSVSKDANHADGAFDCVVANLPWGINSNIGQCMNSGGSNCDNNINSDNKDAATDDDVIFNILWSVRQRIDAGVPCAFISKTPFTSSASFALETAGYQKLGEAHVPSTSFVLPASKKKKPNSIQRNNRNACVVTVAKSIPIMR